MTWTQIAVLLFLGGLAVWAVYEFGWGGGNPRHKDHHSTGGGGWQ